MQRHKAHSLLSEGIIMNTQPLEKLTNAENIVTETDETEALTKSGFTSDEVVSLLWLRQWYQNGGSDRVEVIRRLEFLRHLVRNGNLEP